MTRSTRLRSPAARRGRICRDRFAAGAVLAAVALLVAACNPFSNPPGPTASPSTGSGPTSTVTIIPATPSPTPQLVKTITLVAAVAEPKDATPSGLTWKGVRDAGTRIGASTTLVVPASNADLASAVDRAGATDRAVVVTIGADADAAVQAAAVAHPTAQFLEVDVAVSTAAPGNVHGIVFDEAQAGYLAGFVASSFSGGGKVGFVGDAASDARSANYASGFQSGASQGHAGIGMSVAYAGTADSPDKGRTAAAGLVKSGVDVVAAVPDLSGIGALREACSRKVRLVALEVDAWQTVADVRSCLIVSVLKRYDVAIDAAIARVASGRTVSAITVDDVSSGGIALGEFHVDRPAGFDSQLAGVLSALENGPPHPSPGVPASSPAPPSGSPKP